MKGFDDVISKHEEFDKAFFEVFEKQKGGPKEQPKYFGYSLKQLTQMAGISNAAMLKRIRKGATFEEAIKPRSDRLTIKKEREK